MPAILGRAEIRTNRNSNSVAARHEQHCFQDEDASRGRAAIQKLDRPFFMLPGKRPGNTCDSENGRHADGEHIEQRARLRQRLAREQPLQRQWRSANMAIHKFREARYSFHINRQKIAAISWCHLLSCGAFVSYPAGQDLS